MMKVIEFVFMYGVMLLTIYIGTQIFMEQIISYHRKL